MTDYTKSTNFASKDSLSSGDPLKIVKGTEIDTEFTNIAAAVATKADLSSPTFTGTPSGPTASVGTNTTQFATTALVFAVMKALYPVGCIYTTTVSTNPNTVFGFGTWSAYGAGRVLVSAGGGYTAGSTGGSADAIVAAHTHTFSATSGNQSADHTHGITISDPGHSHGVPTVYAFNFSSGPDTVNTSTTASLNTSTSTATTGITATSGGMSASHNHSVSGTTASTGSSATGANLQPYIVVYMWQRTA